LLPSKTVPVNLFIIKLTGYEITGLILLLISSNTSSLKGYINGESRITKFLKSLFSKISSKSKFFTSASNSSSTNESIFIIDNSKSESVLYFLVSAKAINGWP